MPSLRHVYLRAGKTTPNLVSGCAGTGLTAFRSFEGRSTCPFCMKDLKVKKDNTLPTHTGKRRAYL